MTTKDLTGGPAFPCDLTAYDPEVQVQMQGMTLRDYFAGKALSGLLASEVNAPMGSFVSRAYRLADLMLEERDKA
jgi:hypothetical protein